jgi:hypothetical protein
LLAQVSQALVLATMATRALVSSGVPCRTADAVGRDLARDVAAARFATVAYTEFDITAAQRRAGRPQ